MINEISQRQINDETKTIDFLSYKIRTQIDKVKESKNNEQRLIELKKLDKLSYELRASAKCIRTSLERA